MVEKFTLGTALGRKALIDFNEIVLILNRGNTIPEMTLAEIKTAQAAEIAAGRTFNAIIYDTTNVQLEYWHGNCAIGRPL